MLGMKFAEGGDKYNYIVNFKTAKLKSFGLPILRTLAPS